jgi:hypothetical protein
MVLESVFLGLLFPVSELQYSVGIVSGNSLSQHFDSIHFLLAVSTSETTCSAQVQATSKTSLLSTVWPEELNREHQQ